MFDLHNEWREAKKGIYCLWVCWSRENKRVSEGKIKRGGVCEWAWGGG